MDQDFKFAEVVTYIHSKENLHTKNLIGVTSCIEGAESIFNNYQNLLVLCVDVPRSKYCSNFRDAIKFFVGEKQ